MFAAVDREALSAIVGRDGLLTGADAIGYETPSRHGRGAAAAVVRPRSTEEVSAVIRRCVRAGIPFVIQSGNTGLLAAATPDASGRELILSCDRLSTPLSINIANRSVHAGAGVRLSTLNTYLRKEGFVLPIDLSADPMIGGMIGANTGGARFLRYGDVRRHVLGLQVVLADAEGTVLDLRSALRKNNVGVDLKQLFVGTGGALGVVTEAVLEVRSLPNDFATALVVPIDSHTAPLELLRLFEAHAEEYLTAFEGMSGAAMARAFAHVPTLSNPFADGVPEYAILVELSASGRIAGNGSLADLLAAILADAMQSSIPTIVDGQMDRGQRYWAIRHSLSTALQAAGVVLAFDLAFERDAVFAFRREMTALLRERFAQYEVCDFGHAGDGGVHFSLLRPFDSSSHDDKAVADLVFDTAVRTYGGSFSGEHGVGRANQRIYDRYTPPLQRKLADAMLTSFGIGAHGAVRLGFDHNA